MNKPWVQGEFWRPPERRRGDSRMTSDVRATGLTRMPAASGYQRPRLLCRVG